MQDLSLNRKSVSLQKLELKMGLTVCLKDWLGLLIVLERHPVQSCPHEGLRGTIKHYICVSLAFVDCLPRKARVVAGWGNFGQRQLLRVTNKSA